MKDITILSGTFRQSEMQLLLSLSLSLSFIIESIPIVKYPHYDPDGVGQKVAILLSSIIVSHYLHYD